MMLAELNCGYSRHISHWIYTGCDSCRADQFIEGALIGVYANVKSGLLNVIFSCFICGFALQFLVAFTFPLTGKIMETNGIYEAIDFNTIGYLLARLFSLVR